MTRITDIREYVELYLDTLLSLYEQTDPKLGNDSELGKHELAQRAIDVAWHLHGKLLMWAQAHLAGDAILSENPDFVDYLEKKLGKSIDENSHILEQIGLQYVFNFQDDADLEYRRVHDWIIDFELNMPGNLSKDKGDDRLFNIMALRTLIAELMMSNSSDNSYWRLALLHGLRALNEGEVHELLTPRPGKRQGSPYSLANWKLEALKQVRFRVGRGVKKYVALEEVGKGIGQSPETLRDWEKNLERSHDHRIDLYCSELAGRYFDELNEGRVSAIPNYDGFGMHRGVAHLERAKQFIQTIRNRSLEEIEAKIFKYRQK